MTRRPGMTLTEVLVAIFVVAIGLSGVMAMVPFGAKQMSDALVADRTTTHAVSTDGLVRAYWKEKVVEDASRNGGGEPFWLAMDNPGTHPSLPAQPAIPSTSTEPSYPVFLDPMGVVGRTGAGAAWAGDGAATYVPRRNMNVIGNNSQLALRMWSQADGFSWDEDSRPKVNYDVNNLPTTSPEMRELRYNSLAVIQRPTNRERYNATLKVVVFINRRHLFFPAGSESVFTGVTFTPGSAQLQISTAADIKKGSWIMDATVTANTTIRHANFYRVVSATDNGAVVAGVPMYDVELHTPVKRVDGKNTAADAYSGTVVVMPGVAAVFERPVLTGNTN